MSTIIIKLEKEDIITCKYGENYVVKCVNGLEIVFSPESLVELINDYNEINNIT